MSLSKEEMKVWTDLIDWLTEQEGFVIVGLKDGAVNARSSVELDEAYMMVDMLAEALSHSLERGDSKGLQSLQ